MANSTNRILIAIFISSLFLTGCMGEEEPKNKEQEVFAIPVGVTTLARGNISSSYHSTAVLETRHDAQVISRVTGIIEKLVVEEGDYVEKGQLLAEIDSRRYQLRLSQAQAELASINQELKRVMQLHNRKLVSADKVDKLKYQQQSAQASHDLAALDLKDSRVQAPISGFIAKRLVKQGHFTQGYQKLLHIVDQENLQAVVHLPEVQLEKIALGQTAHLSFSALPNKQFTAKVRSISPIVDTQSGTFKVIMSLSNKEKTLKPGMFAQISLVFDTHQNALRVPSDAVINRDGQQYIYVVKDNKAQEVAVSLGFIQEQLTEITGEINSGQQVIVSGQHNVKHGTLINVLNEDITLSASTSVASDNSKG